jgi:hypothetical protein
MVAEIENLSKVEVGAVKGNFIQELRVEGKKFRRNFVANLANVSGKGVPAGVQMLGEDSMRLELKLVRVVGAQIFREILAFKMNGLTSRMGRLIRVRAGRLYGAGMCWRWARK